ncbi:MAG: FAA hydrolase family protein [Gemmataceae bacterium]|nr:FAA hydrolase family protein [Gemmataceae bacterium]
MHVCRSQQGKTIEIAIYDNDRLIPINRAARELKIAIPTADSTSILDYLAPHGKSAKAAAQVLARFSKLPASAQRRLSRPVKGARIKVPVPHPKKVILLAGNYAAHIVEGGGVAPERAATFPYFFWKPPTTTLTDPGAPIRIPRVSPDHVDWEIELGVIIGRTARHVSEAKALSHVAGYTVCNDISDRRFRINPERQPRDKDAFFDWQHGKWHDTFLPMGPCVRTAASLPDPQKLRLVLKVNGNVMQDASTAQMIFPAAALISILSSFVTLEPGDIIVTGTPSGVGHARKPPIYLKPRDQVEAEIEGIGILRNPVAAGK